ncbi:expressed unknown protein [Seminavis robusta]|uniref:DUF6824 domain-containing protein n=1 Tax=Seminavis robusta TaxID=568900 RepID=A0A9N8DLG3_9STRA|nr:expressed unknown protein [Seminavis robusta]|eukprot:Sro146_g067710.1 n/a (311) ;mRNA; r:96155-97538
MASDSGMDSDMGDKSQAMAPSSEARAEVVTGLAALEQYINQETTKPGTHDVLFGRGGETNNHSGNIKFRQTVVEYRKDYKMACKMDKPLISRKLVAYWRSLQPPGRFLAKTNRLDAWGHFVWKDVGDKAAQKRVSKNLGERDKKRPSSFSSLMQQSPPAKHQSPSVATLPTDTSTTNSDESNAKLPPPMAPTDFNQNIESMSVHMSSYSGYPQTSVKDTTVNLKTEEVLGGSLGNSTSNHMLNPSDAGPASPAEATSNVNAFCDIIGANTSGRFLLENSMPTAAELVRSTFGERSGNNSSSNNSVASSFN